VTGNADFFICFERARRDEHNGISHFRPRSGHLDAVGRLACFNDPESYAGGSFQAPGRVTHARQVEG